eukprot:CAMPEP_0177734548 /NCGR_PEP_ID=MMETSP0484_2-20121128/24292_1 /TAXON_ID=354590 /ORGANISM="Rhodomonas lens, Strain RHODO" /LENGTH=119 /DNA_ID=CAMNT_0019248033 /DNA_START=70 /DNA_END=426 /DNA_ORIENTATION=+
MRGRPQSAAKRYSAAMHDDEETHIVCVCITGIGGGSLLVFGMILWFSSFSDGRAAGVQQYRDFLSNWTAIYRPRFAQSSFAVVVNQSARVIPMTSDPSSEFSGRVNSELSELGLGNRSD